MISRSSVFLIAGFVSSGALALSILLPPLWNFKILCSIFCWISIGAFAVHCATRGWGTKASTAATAALLSAAVIVLAGSKAHQNYQFGFDDGFYYSYLPSILIDHDLDLTNQYECIGFPPDIFQRKTPIGLLKNEFPIGPALLWSPFFTVGHLISRIWGFTPDGFSAPYITSVILGNIIYCFLGLWFIFLSVSRLYSKPVSMFATLAVWMGTSLFVYSTRIYLVSETVSMFAVSLVIWLVFSQRTSRPSHLFILGVACALAIMVRLHNLFFLVLPLLAIWQARLTGNSEPTMKTTLVRSFILFAGVILGLLPQFLVWKGLYGSWLINAGQYLLWWKDPRILELLFSARKGLFSWTPLALLSVTGLILLYRRSGFWAISLFVIFLVNTYINAAQWDWWGATSFGARRFTNCVPIFAFGIAALIAHISRQRIRTGFLILVILLLMQLNFFLSRAYRRGRLQYDHADRFTEVLSEGPYKAWIPIIYGIELPVQLKYSLAYGIPFYGKENEFFIGDDILYFQLRHGDLIFGSENPIFADEWTYQPHSLRLCQLGKCRLNLPMFFKYDNDLVIVFSVAPQNLKSKEATFTVMLAGTPILTCNIGPTETEIKIPLYRYFYPKKVTILQMNLTDERGEPVPFELRSLSFHASQQRRPEDITQ